MIAQINEMYQEVNSIFNEKIKPVADRLEKKRLSKLRATKILNILAIICAVIFVVILCIPKNGSFAFTNPEFLNDTAGALLGLFGFLVLILLTTPVPYIILALIFWFTGHVVKNSYTNLVKKELYPLIFKAMGSDLNYLSGKFKFIPSWLYNIYVGNFTLFEIQEFINLSVFASKLKNIDIKNIDLQKICPKSTNISPDDVITGKYKGKPVNIIDFALYNRYDSGFSKVYQGVLFQTKLSKNFSSNVVIRQRNLNFAIVHGMQKVELESNEFNKIYEVYATDQVEARYLLTTSLMEKMIDIHQKGQGLNLQVQNQSVTVVKQTREDMFEPDINKPVNNVNSYYEVLLQTKLILDLITDLNLDRTTGL